MTDLAIIVTVRVDDLARPPPGSKKVRCSLCGCLCWLAPSNPLKGQAFEVQCRQCSSEVIKDVEGFMPLTEDQREEIAKSTGLSEERIDQYVEEMERAVRSGRWPGAGS